MTATSPDTIDYQLIGLVEDGGTGDLLAELDQKQGRVRLQALISEWLRMENLVVLTGSGTSVSAGGKTMANLEAAVLEPIHTMVDLPAAIAPILAEDRQPIDGEDATTAVFYSISNCQKGLKGISFGNFLAKHSCPNQGGP